jgi:hypothetical protein
MLTADAIVDIALACGDRARAGLLERGHDPVPYEPLLESLEESVAGLLAAREFRAAEALSVPPALSDVGRWQRHVAAVQRAIAAEPPGQVPMPPTTTSLRLQRQLTTARAARRDPQAAVMSQPAR